MECGFSDPKYLIKHFKQYFTCSPSDFRKKYKPEV
ncbi:MAG TPA: AraC family transcriptional regulator [Clostridiaceae bacterium]|nr:AraC family transcriptional regulator [Clostridiaceae bacterium]